MSLASVFRWMEACLKEELPETTELEEALRNGVFLAKLGNFFSPETVPLRKIFDKDFKVLNVSNIYSRDIFVAFYMCLFVHGVAKFEGRVCKSNLL